MNRIKKLILTFALIGSSLFAKAQNQTLLPENFRQIKSHINLEFYTSANAYFTEGKFDEAAFKVNRVRLEIYGKLSDQLSYNFRQSFNKYHNPFALDNIASSIEYANITWHPSSKFSFVSGKQFVALGGYEYYVNALRVREFSEFNGTVACYQAGVAGLVQLSPTQELILQVTNNRSGSDSDLYVYGLPSDVQKSKMPLLATLNWNGNFADNAIQLRYAASVGGLAQNRNIYYLTAGNIYEKGPVLAYFDVMYSREGLDSQNRLSVVQNNGYPTPVTAQNVQYLTLIGNVDYSFHPKWNAYIKGVYETASVYKNNGMFDTGRYLTNWNGQACIEWFPFTQEKGFKVFVHYLYKGNIMTEKALKFNAIAPDTQRISLGIVYAIPVL